MTATEIKKMLTRVGVPARYQQEGVNFDDFGKVCQKAGHWLIADNGTRALRNGAVAVFSTHNEDGHWAYHLTHVYLALKPVPTRRFDAWELTQMGDEQWAALEESKVIFIDDLLTKHTRSAEAIETQSYFIKLALDRNIGLVIMNDRAQSEDWDRLSDRTAFMIREAIKFRA